MTRTFPWILLAAVLFWSCAETPPPQIPPVDDCATCPPSGGRAALRIDIPNARMPFDGVLTGGQPTMEQLETAARAGYRTVVNLRTQGEEGAWDEAPKAAELGLRYVVIPVAGAAGLTVENAEKLADVLNDEQTRPVMVHCGSGNRVGGLFAVKAFHLDGESAETALRIGKEAGLTRLEEVVKERLVAREQRP